MISNLATHDRSEDLSQLEVDSFEGNKLFANVAQQSAYSKFKHILNVLIVVILAPAALSVVAIVALTVLLLMGWPAIIMQDRIGLGGRPFRLLKLRTMAVALDGRCDETVANDPRITPFGRFLRRSHIDELPQLWNVLTGEMSLIGPRPELVHQVEKYRESIDHYDLRHLVRPGLTGLAQVFHGYAVGVSETRDKLKYDLFYIEHFGPKLDFIIFVRTLKIYLDPRFVR